MTTPRWKLEATLRRHRKSATPLARASGLTRTTIHNIPNNKIPNNKSQAVELETLGKLLSGLEVLEAENTSLAGLLEVGAAR